MSKLPKGLRGVKTHTIYYPKKKIFVHRAYTLESLIKARKLLEKSNIMLKEKENSFLEELENLPFVTPIDENTNAFTDNLSRLLKTGYVRDVVKSDYNFLYPSILKLPKLPDCEYEHDIHELDYKDRSQCIMFDEMPCELCSVVCTERLKEWKAQGKLKNVTYENGFISYTLAKK